MSSALSTLCCVLCARRYTRVHSVAGIVFAFLNTNRARQKAGTTKDAVIASIKTSKNRIRERRYYYYMSPRLNV